MLKLGAIKLIVAIAQKDDAVRPVAVLIGDVPVVVHLLETDEQVIALERALACDRPQHRQEEGVDHRFVGGRSEEHTSELQSLMRISYAVFCLKKKKKNIYKNNKSSK